MAVTDTEIYRRFRGELRPAFLRFLPITASGIQVGARNKLAMLLLYVPPGIGTIIMSFVVYTKYAALAESQTATGIRERAMAILASRMVEVRDEIVTFNSSTRLFALLAIVWYAGGLLAEDRRLGAHQLYFSRPMTRLDYVLGKLGVACFWGALATLVPGLVICTIASFSSPQWEFLRNEWDVILKTIGYSALWLSTVSLVVLAFSSLTDRRYFAMAAAFGFFMITDAIGGSLSDLYDDERYAVVGIGIGAFQVIADSLFDVRRPAFDDADPALAWLVVGIVWTLAVGTLAVRMRKLEVVA